jgi:hypothetical protein
MGKGYKKNRNKKVREHKPRPDSVEGGSLNFVSSVVDRGNFKMEYV